MSADTVNLVSANSAYIMGIAPTYSCLGTSPHAKNDYRQFSSKTIFIQTMEPNSFMNACSIPPVYCSLFCFVIGRFWYDFQTRIIITNRT